MIVTSGDGLGCGFNANSFGVDAEFLCGAGFAESGHFGSSLGSMTHLFIGQ